MYLMKGMAALAMGLVAVSCSKSDFDQSAYQQAKEQESKESFMNNVMGGQNIDPNQTWSTTTTVQLNVSSEIAEGVLKVYASSPVGQNVPALYVGSINKGEQKTITVTCPSDAPRLYVAVYDADNYMRYEVANVKSTNLNVKFASSNAVSAPARRAPGTYYTNSHKFASAPADEDFATELPSTYVTDTNANGGGYGVNVVIQSPTIDYLNLWNAGSTIYFPKGNWTVNGQYVGSNSKVYLLPGANVTFNGEYNLNSSDAAMYIAEGATFNATNISFNFKLYNRGNINVGNLTQYNYGFVYNEGIITATGEVSPKNSNAEVINAIDGEITAAAMNVEGSAHVLNEGKVNISGLTHINSNNLSWVNNGYFHTKNFKYEAGSWNVINNCKLVVDKEYYMVLGQNQGEFKLDGSIECETFIHGIGYTKMTGKSLIKVAETLTCQAMADGCYFGFYGPESDENGYAVIQAKKITAQTLTQRRSITYRNYLIVATDDHWEQCDANDNSVNGNYPYWDQGDNVKMSLKDKNDITQKIEATDCNAGLEGKTTITIDEPTYYYYYAFEDLGAIGDFDFNDVVLRLSAPDNGTSTVELVAAGGTLPVQVTYNGANLGNEVHQEFNVDVTTMVNTGYEKKDFVTLGTVNIADDADMSNLPFGIVVTGNDGVSVKVAREVDHKGTAPLMIVVSGYTTETNSGKWFWAREHVNINTAYPQFGAWGANVQSNTNWYWNYTDGNVWEY